MSLPICVKITQNYGVQNEPNRQQKSFTRSNNKRKNSTRLRPVLGHCLRELILLSYTFQVENEIAEEAHSTSTYITA